MTDRMHWSQLLSKKRIGRGEADNPEEGDLRSEFEKDYHQVTMSAAFRRLQDKTQVFPLDKSDFIRTRLTHSLEVSSIAKALALNIGEAVCVSGKDPEFGIREKEAVSEILQCAGLIHDIGNPPFGHFGEEAIREWFRRYFGSKAGRDKMELIGRSACMDLLDFEGNAQAFRLVTKLGFPGMNGGMNLTEGVLSAMIKYPHSSAEKEIHGISGHKFGYFRAEEKTFLRVADDTGTGKRRNPIVYVLEAADDIAYSTADIEDAYKKGFFSYSAFVRELKRRGTPQGFIRRLTELKKASAAKGSSDPEEYAVRMWLAEMQNTLIRSATGSFLSHYEELMRGELETPLIFSGEAYVLLCNLKQIAYDYAFTSMSIYKTEIAANKILTGLMDEMVPAALSYDRENKPGLLEEKYLSLIPEEYFAVYHRSARGRSDGEREYLKLLLVTDFISGMTDSFARNLYLELNGSVI